MIKKNNRENRVTLLKSVELGNHLIAQL